MDREWYYTTGGQQAGPVSWDDLRVLTAQRKLAPGDHVWYDDMTEWAEARTVAGLFPAKGPPPLPPTTAVAVTKPAKVTGEVVLEGLGGAVLPGQMNKMDVKLDGKPLGTGSLVAGVRLPFESTVGHHTVEVAMSGGITSLLGGFGKKIEGAASGRSYPVEFPTAGHYLLTMTRAKVRGMPPSGVEVNLTAEAAQELALAPVAEEVPEQGLVQKGFAAIGRGMSNMRESSRRAQLHGLWESVSGEGVWFLFTKDGGLLRGDGFAAKFRWADEETVELFESGSDVVVPLKLVSLGKHELILKVGGQSGHFRRVQTISEAVQQQQREEAERRFAEWRDRTVGVLALGGLAVLVGAVTVAGGSGGGAVQEAAPAKPSGGVKPAVSERVCASCRGKGWQNIGSTDERRCPTCGGQEVERETKYS